MREKVIYILSDIDKALAFEWIVDHIDKNKIDIQFILLGKETTELIIFLMKRNVVFHNFQIQGKLATTIAWIKTLAVLLTQRPKIVHTHLYKANIIGLTAAWVCRIKKRIHTRHHASIHHRYFPQAVYVDKLVNWLSTDIVVMSSTLMHIVCVLEKTPRRKVHLIPHGFDLNYFKPRVGVANVLKKQYEIPEFADPVVGVISRYTAWKGVQYIIPAFKKFISSYPNAHLVLSNANGDYADEIKQKLKDLPDGTFTEISFENDVASLYQLFDVFIHTPIDSDSEAFGQTYIEALASKVPAIVTLSGIANDFIEHERNAIVVDYKDTDSIYKALLRIVTDAYITQKITNQGRADVEQRFELSLMINKLQNLYLNYPDV
jgi:glycosyltransferase involved in cell wall biosynthesis